MLLTTGQCGTLELHNWLVEFSMLQRPLENTVKSLREKFFIPLSSSIGEVLRCANCKVGIFNGFNSTLQHRQWRMHFKLKAVNGQLDCYSVLPPSIIAWRMEFPKHGFWRPQNKLTPVPVQLARPKSPLPCSPLSESPSTFSVTVSIFLFYSFFFLNICSQSFSRDFCL